MPNWPCASAGCSSNSPRHRPQCPCGRAMPSIPLEPAAESRPPLDDVVEAALRRLTEGGLDSVSMPDDASVRRRRRLAGLAAGAALGVLLVSLHAGLGDRPNMSESGGQPASTVVGSGSGSQRLEATPLPMESDGPPRVETKTAAAPEVTEALSELGSDPPPKSVPSGARGATNLSSPTPGKDGATGRVLARDNAGFELEVFRDPSVCSSLVRRRDDGGLQHAEIPAAGATNECPSGRSSPVRKP
jgi:hypothetical protein